MRFQQEDNGKQGQFFFIDDVNTTSLIEYVYAGPKKVIISHTEVSDRMKGKQLGKALVNAVTEFAKENDIKIIPLCPFAKAVMTKNEKYKDVLV